MTQNIHTNNKNQKVLRRFVSKGVFPHQWAFTLLFPIRNIFLSPEQLIKRMELKEHLTVMELGPGPGYFALKVAQRLTAGKLVLADIQQQMLDYAQKRFERKSIANAEYYLCDGQQFSFEDNHFDIIYMVTVIGEVEHKDRYMKEIYRMLKEGGMLSISESMGDPDRMTTVEICKLALNHGFVFHNRFGSELNFTINFKKL